MEGSSHIHVVRGNPQWTEVSKQLLIELWESCSIREIAERIGVSKNSVVGKAHRLGLSSKGLKWTQAGRERRRKRKAGEPVPPLPKKRGAYKPRKRIVPKPVPPPAPTPETGIHILDLGFQHCREVIGRGKDDLARYCGAAIRWRRDRWGRMVADSFCQYHAHRNYRPSHYAD